MDNASMTINNILTPKNEVVLEAFGSRTFTLRKCDLAFDAFINEHFGDSKRWFELVNSKGTAKETSYAIARAFYHLISRDDQIFLRDNVVLENPLDEDGNEIKVSSVDKILIVSNATDVSKMVMALLKAKGFSMPNPLTEAEKKKKKNLKKATRKAK